MRLAQDKWLTCRVLRSIGLPATRNQRVASVEQALELARRWGWPVVIKPADQERGRGVAAHLMNEAALRDAYAAARTVSKDVLLERHVEGFGHRFTVHDGELVSVLRRVPGGVTGDGTRTVAELVRLQREADLRRSMNLGRIELDAEALSLLADCGLDAAHVPAPGGFVLLRRRDNIAAGGRLERLDPASVHPDNVRAALRAAQALHLDFAGIDFLSTDIAQSWRRNGAQICEVNARPQFGPGADGLNYDRVLQRLLGGQTRIPVHLLLCCDPSAPGGPGAVEALRRSLGLQSMACRRGVWVAGEPHAGRCRNGYSAAVAALGDREVSSLLFAMSPAEVLDLGLPTARVDAVHLEAGAWPETEAARRAEALARCACAKIHHAPNGLTPGACGRLEAASQPGALLILPR
jgi:cyanophycin synthetase